MYYGAVFLSDFFRNPMIALLLKFFKSHHYEICGEWLRNIMSARLITGEIDLANSKTLPLNDTKYPN